MQEVRKHSWSGLIIKIVSGLALLILKSKLFRKVQTNASLLPNSLVHILGAKDADPLKQGSLKMLALRLFLFLRLLLRKSTVGAGQLQGWLQYRQFVPQ